MKKILLICLTGLLFFMCSCEKDEIWGDGLPEMEHVYYIGFYKTNINTDYLTYEIDSNGDTQWKHGTSATNGTFVSTEAKWEVAVPFQFHSEYVRSYNAVNYFWVTNADGSSLVAGTDYNVTDENETVITPDAQGAYALTWLQTRKGVRNIKFKRLTSATGSLKVNVLNPANGAPDASDLATTVNNQTNDFEVRGFTFDYNKVTINFK